MEMHEALLLAERAFPEGPEALAKELSIEVEYSDLDGCEGWCVGKPGNYLVRINSRSCPERQRFTLAHEISHILLFSTPDLVMKSTAEEREVNTIASQILLPKKNLLELAGGKRPIPRETVIKIASRANVSYVVTARRLVTVLSNGSFVSDIDVVNQTVKWTFPANACPVKCQLDLYRRAFEASNSIEQGDRRVDLFCTSWTTTMLVQSTTQATAR